MKKLENSEIMGVRRLMSTNRLEGFFLLQVLLREASLGGCRTNEPRDHEKALGELRENLQNDRYRSFRRHLGMLNRCGLKSNTTPSKEGHNCASCGCDSYAHLQCAPPSA